MRKRPLLLVLLALAVLAAGGAVIAVDRASETLDPTDVVSVPPGSFGYRVAGEFLRDGTPMNAPLATVAFERPVTIMKWQVRVGEYRACVKAGACRPVAAGPGAADDEPVVGVSFHDAEAYAAYLSRQTGNRYRLPSDAEWAYAAAERFRDDALAVDGDAANPATRWLAAYESEAAAMAAIRTAPRPSGSFGVNAHGVGDLAGNVWEWTDTCFVRHAAGPEGKETRLESCGVRVAEGSHRAYLSDFIRDPTGGACSAGAPPANLGIRLVRENGGFVPRAAAALRRVFDVVFDRAQPAPGPAV